MAIDAKINEKSGLLKYCAYCEKLVWDFGSSQCPNCREIKINRILGQIEI
jgi:hypothetical protein